MITTYALETLKTSIESMGYENISVNNEDRMLAFNAYADDFNFVIVVNSIVLESNYIKFSVFPTNSKGEFIDISNFGEKSTPVAIKMLTANSIDDYIGSWCLNEESLCWSVNLKTPKNWVVEITEVQEIFGVIYKEVVSNMRAIFF